MACHIICFVSFRFVSFVLFRFVSICFVSFRSVSFRFVSICFVSFRSVSFRSVSFLFRFALYRDPQYGTLNVSFWSIVSLLRSFTNKICLRFNYQQDFNDSEMAQISSFFSMNSSHPSWDGTLNALAYICKRNLIQIPHCIVSLQSWRHLIIYWISIYRFHIKIRAPLGTCKENIHIIS